MDCEDCPICAEPKDTQFTHTLKCGHEFHYNCLFLSFKNMKDNLCPCCRSGNNLLPLVNGIKKIYPGIHNMDNAETYENVKCKKVLTRGKNKGKYCTRYCLLGMEYCSIHIKDKEIINTKEITNTNEIINTKDSTEEANDN
tara:strand:- start:967 stop:1389 length:423 start_codon:yes stop_codon:yes gene_type:complete